MNYFGCWLGPKEPSLEFVKRWPGGGKLYDESITLYGIPWLLENKYFSDAYDAKNWVAASDVMRIALLYEYGGVYMDTDVEIISKDKFSGLLKTNDPTMLLAGREDREWIGTAVIVSQLPKHPALKSLLDAYNSTIRYADTYASNGVTGPTLFTQHIKDRDDVKILPTDVFYPWHWSEKLLPKEMLVSRITTNTVAAHHWFGSWL